MERKEWNFAATKWEVDKDLEKRIRCFEESVKTKLPGENIGVIIFKW
jgi:hypothetical protein